MAQPIWWHDLEHIIMRIATVTILSILFAAQIQAQELSFQFMKGETSSGRTIGKNLSASYRPNNRLLAPRFVAGLFNTSNIQSLDYEGHLDAYFDLKIVNKAGIYIQVGQGLSVLNKPRELQTHIQFPTQFEVGLVNDDGYGIGLQYTHYSNGKPKNRGRDYMGISVTIPLGKN